MTNDDIQDKLFHVEQFLTQCRVECRYPDKQCGINDAHAKLIEANNALFPDMSEYRRQFDNPTG